MSFSFTNDPVVLAIGGLRFCERPRNRDENAQEIVDVRRSKLNKTRGVIGRAVRDSMGQGGKLGKSRTKGSKKAYVSEDRGGGRSEDFQSSINFTTPLCLSASAYQSGVRSQESPLSGLTSPRPSSSRTTPSCPFEAAYKSGVPFVMSGLLGLKSPVPVVAVPPPPAHSQQCTRAAFGYHTDLSGLISPRPSRSCTTPSCPFPFPAYESGVRR